MLQISIIIVNYNVKFFLELCLHSVQKASAGIKTEIFVVDNNSSDGSQIYLATKFPEVIFKWNTNNVGFGKASNSVLSQTKGSYILFLNPDTIVPEDCFIKCLNFFKQQNDCGAIGVKMINGSGVFLKESKRSFPSPAASFFKLSGLAAVFPKSRIFARYYAGHLPENKNHETDALAGAFMMLSKAAIEKTGGFDEDFFMYGEDIDLSYRIQKSGLKNYYFADTTIIHFKGESTQKLSGDYIKHFYGAMKLFVQKHYTGKKGIKMTMLRSIYISGKLAKMKNNFFGKKNKKNMLQQNAAIVATDKEFNKLLEIIKYAHPPIIINGRLAIEENEKENSLKPILTFLKKNKISQVIFCQGNLSFKKIIEILSLFPKSLSYLFHAENSNSIAGDGKDKRGIFITKEE